MRFAGVVASVCLVRGLIYGFFAVLLPPQPREFLLARAIYAGVSIWLSVVRDLRFRVSRLLRIRMFKERL